MILEDYRDGKNMRILWCDSGRPQHFLHKMRTEDHVSQFIKPEKMPQLRTMAQPGEEQLPVLRLFPGGAVRRDRLWQIL